MRFVLLATSLASLAGIVLAKPEKIRGVTDPVYHLYLQAYPKDKSIPVLGPEASAEFFNIAGTIQSANSSSYLNIGGDATSYKTLQLSNASGTSAWGLEGDTIITTQSSSWGRQLNFLVCQLDTSYWQLYLQTGSDVPTGRNCSNYQTIHLPCLC
ncbi:hypothetical protein CaCOL14_005922 [Colletotrichum acutatum]|uniref:Uncharacterized protein n=2 Tax=Colletotrichum acutatum species complex TaxID=2707335 RepID=A0AAI9ZLF9_9PEZI|nr:uncharacterized protein BDZ83DRAFT_676404 [Colletotrichum acutatum]XP_060442468.1 uncharacterized protein BDP81DRAFT_62185 [Colletotrichum phormii]KAK1633861.1 hypothetical protein BDP81DRAFT_62185 [Colletotrichum phormii]KAK1722288.1 hypothetical protein BDZ83DRAFT_676404 [Colletotrichum acutatum]